MSVADGAGLRRCGYCDVGFERGYVAREIGMRLLPQSSVVGSDHLTDHALVGGQRLRVAEKPRFVALSETVFVWEGFALIDYTGWIFDGEPNFVMRK